MITLRRLGHSDEPFQLNPDMIVTVESTPDTVIGLATGAKVVVCETPEEVAEAVRNYRAEVLGDAMRKRRPERQPRPGGASQSAHRDGAHLSAVEDPGVPPTG
jgi:flagellar protein FlbD